jgi:FAD synthetase
LQSLEELSISYNGGKDCLVLLILLLVSLNKRPKAASLPPKLQSVYIISPHPFAEVDSFVDDSVTRYSLDLARYEMPMKEAFKLYLEEHKNVKAIMVGTRRTDPHGQLLTHFDPTDHGWPAFMRVHPVIDWHYAEIWAASTPFFLRGAQNADEQLVYTAFGNSILFLVRSRIYISWWHERHLPESGFESGKYQ